MSLHVAGGELNGRKLQAGPGIRPTTEKVREAIFSVLVDVSGARTLDLFCGSGALGIEAVSRGAKSATLVDSRARTAHDNVKALELSDRVEVVSGDAVAFLEGVEEGAYDLILCDPPYKLADRLDEKLDPLISRAVSGSGRVIVESDARRPLELTLPLDFERRYGDTLVRIYKPKGKAKKKGKK